MGVTISVIVPAYNSRELLRHCLSAIAASDVVPLETIVVDDGSTDGSDEVARSFGVRVNGRAVFAKGANWIPADALFGRITPEAVRGLLQSAVDVHMSDLLSGADDLANYQGLVACGGF